MDTDDLSEMAYGIIVRAALVSDTLKAELGTMSRDHKNENDWLAGVLEHCREIIADSDGYVDYWNLAEEEGVKAKRICELAEELSCLVDIVLSTPQADRGPESSVC